MVRGGGEDLELGARGEGREGGGGGGPTKRGSKKGVCVAFFYFILCMIYFLFSSFSSFEFVLKKIVMVG